MDNLETLKQQWKQTSLRIDALERRNRQTTLDNISATYRRLVLIGSLALLPGGFGLRCFAPLGATVLYVVIMVLAIIIDAMLWRRTRAINPATMTVSDVAARAAANRRLHLGSQMVMAPLAIVFLIAMLTGADEYLRGAIIVGAIVGALCGAGIWRKIMRNYKALINSANDSFADLDDTK